MRKYILDFLCFESTLLTFSAVMAVWRETTVEVKVHRVILIRASKKMFMGLQVKAIDSWRRHLYESKRAKYVTSRAVKYMGHGAVGPAWRRWREYTTETVRQRRVLSNAAARFGNSRCGTCRCCRFCMYMPAIDRSLSDCR